GGGAGFFAQLRQIVTQLPRTHLPTLLVGGATLALLVLVEHYFRRLPAALLALVFGLAVSALLGLQGMGVQVVRDIPAGLAPPRIPYAAPGDILILLPGALGITLVSFAQGIGPAETFARAHGYEIDANKELVGLGAANLGAGLFQGFALGSSLSRSAANDAAGAQTQMSALIAAALT